MRLFVGVPPSGAARESLAAYMRDLKGRWPWAKWVAPENLHYTIVFIGEAPESDIHPVSLALDDAVRALAPFEVTLGSPGSFPRHGRARVLWVGTGEGERKLTEVAERCREGIKPWNDAGDKDFVPHLTIARFRVPERIGGELPALAAAPPWAVADVVLYESVLGPSGPRYRAIHASPLHGSAL